MTRERKDQVDNLHPDQDPYNVDVRPLNPFGARANQFLTEDLPRLNSEKDAETLATKITEFAGNFRATIPSRELTIAEWRAVTRDGSFMWASEQTLGLGHNQDLEYVLLYAASKTGESPIGTITHYVEYNPDDENERGFTLLPEEKKFKRALRMAIEGWGEGIEPTLEALNMSVGDPGFTPRLEIINTGFIKAREALRIAYIKPEIFTHFIKIFFNKTKIGGETYPAASAAQGKNLVSEYAIYGLGEPDPIYQRYYRDNIQRLPRPLREIASEMTGTSLVDKMEQEALFLQEIGQSPLEAAKMMDLIMKNIMRFQRPHLGIAVENFDLREPEEGQENVEGSGGYDLSMLKRLGRIRQSAADKMEALYKELGGV